MDGLTMEKASWHGNHSLFITYITHRHQSDYYTIKMCPSGFDCNSWLIFTVLSVHLTLLEHAIPVDFLSVHLSVKRMICDKTKEICAYILIPHEKNHSSQFSDKKNDCWGRGITNFGPN